MLIMAKQSRTGLVCRVAASSNTSFNGNGEPIIETVNDALECFNKLALDYLIIGDSIVLKKTGCRTVDIKIHHVAKANIACNKIWDTIHELMPNEIGKERARFLLFNKYVRWVKEGRKHTTIRYRRGSIDYPSDLSLPMLATDDFGQQYIRMVGRAVIQRIEVKQFGQLTVEDANNDGFASIKELKNVLQEIYGKIDEKELVTIYFFHLVGQPNEKASR